MTTTSAVSDYLEHVASRDLAAAARVAMMPLEEGGGLDEVVGLLSAAQREVGDRWARNEWSVAQEHAATAVTDRVAALAAAAVNEPVVLPAVLVLCAEGDWHTLPGRMFADQLRARRWDARFLGGSIPARDLAQHVAEERPLAVAVSCAVPLFLPGAAETIAAVHAAGVAVIAGGEAFGHHERRALAIGADAWAPSVAVAESILQSWQTQGSPALGVTNPESDEAYRLLRGDRLAVVAEAMRNLTQRLAYLRTADERQVQRTQEDLDYLLGFLEATMITGDRTILAGYFPWLQEVLTSRGVPAAVMTPTVQCVTAALRACGNDHPAAVLEDAARQFLPDPP